MAATSRTSMIDVVASRSGMTPDFRWLTNESDISPAAEPAGGPRTPDGYVMTTGAPSACSPRAYVSASAFERPYAPVGCAGGRSACTIVAPGLNSALTLET